jgi:hypothetical protein
MSFTSDITIVDASTNDAVYSTISMAESKSIRKDDTRELGTPRSLTISHQTTGKNMTAIDRHLVRLDLVEEDSGSDDIATLSGSVYVVIENPRRIVTKTMVKDMVVQLVNFLTDANVEKVLSGQL